MAMIRLAASPFSVREAVVAAARHRAELPATPPLVLRVEPMAVSASVAVA